MRKVFFVIVFFFIGLLPGCRGQRQMETTETKQQTSETAVEFHDLQRFWNSLAERLNFKIEFYPAEGGPRMPTTDNCVPIDPTAFVPPALPSGSAEGCFGSVKSMEFSSERIAADSSFALTDSVADSKSAEASDAHTEKASELRQDNGTVATVCIVFAVAALIYLCIKQFIKK
jgi:hypothetical protein